ncbi:hypothetical protein Golomagni_07550 [Golovinomyces magnicellulatus]|nr:hypothetical protein Golomagni_07550 [Golovinomyces magnicellulatus]
MYPSFEEIRSERQPIGMCEDFKRLYWPLSGTFPSAQAVMKTTRGAKEAMESLQDKNGNWHEIAFLPVTEPKVSSIKVILRMLNEYEPDWVSWHENHQAAEYVEYGDLDDDTRPFGEQREDLTWEADSDTPYLARCCGEDRPIKKNGLSVRVTPTSGDFVTIRDYVAAVHPWMMSLREDIIGANIVAADGCNMSPEEARTMDWKVSVRHTPSHYILTHKQWLGDHTPKVMVSLDDPSMASLRRAIARDRAERQQREQQWQQQHQQQ